MSIIPIHVERPFPHIDDDDVYEDDDDGDDNQQNRSRNC